MQPTILWQPQRVRQPQRVWAMDDMRLHRLHVRAFALISTRLSVREHSPCTEVLGSNKYKIWIFLISLGLMTNRSPLLWLHADLTHSKMYQDAMVARWRYATILNIPNLTSGQQVHPFTSSSHWKSLHYHSLVYPVRQTTVSECIPQLAHQNILTSLICWNS
jgi:hypothetical protein